VAGTDQGRRAWTRTGDRQGRDPMVAADPNGYLSGEAMKSRTVMGLLLLVCALPSGIAGEDRAVTEIDRYLLLDDFSTDRSTLDTAWEGFTDRVMGGVSQISVLRIPDPQGTFIRMRGRVSLENNGGFVQIRLKLTSSLRCFDGSTYRGIRLRVRGEGSGYYIFLRTANTIVPWKYYAAPVPVDSDWQVVDIPWSDFEAGDYGRLGRLRTDRLRSVALVAYGKAFDAQVDLKEIGLY
jgi:hypothetical protein